SETSIPTVSPTDTRPHYRRRPLGGRRRHGWYPAGWSRAQHRAIDRAAAPTKPNSLARAIALKQRCLIGQTSTSSTEPRLALAGAFLDGECRRTPIRLDFIFRLRTGLTSSPTNDCKKAALAPPSAHHQGGKPWPSKSTIF